jgi:hypothetical protein
MNESQETGEACCEMMLSQAKNLSQRAVEDAVIVYNKVFDEFGIPVNDGGTSKITIAFCPWCGARLRESKRARWFHELGRMGIDEPDDARVPDAYRSDSWWRSRS